MNSTIRTMQIFHHGSGKHLKQAIWEPNMEISSHILSKTIVGPVSHSLIIKVELLLVSKAECFIS